MSADVGNSQGNIRALPPPARSLPVSDVVELLERWLSRAKAGEVRGVALVGVHESSVVTQEMASGDGDHFALLAGITIQQHRLCTLKLGQAVPTPPTPDEPETEGPGA